MMRSGCRRHIAFTYSLVTGGVPIVVSRSSATRTACTPASVKSLMTWSSSLAVQRRFPYFSPPPPQRPPPASPPLLPREQSGGNIGTLGPPPFPPPFFSPSARRGPD